MMSKYALPLLAIIGLVFAIGAVIQGNETPAITLPPVQAAKVPFASYVAGAGIIEASTENIAIGTPVHLPDALETAIWSIRIIGTKMRFDGLKSKLGPSCSDADGMAAPPTEWDPAVAPAAASSIRR